MQPATKPAAAVETTRALRRCFDSCLNDCRSSAPETLPLVLAAPAVRDAAEADAEAAGAAPERVKVASAALMHCPAALLAEPKPALLTAASPSDACMWLTALASRSTD